MNLFHYVTSWSLKSTSKDNLIEESAIGVEDSDKQEISRLDR